MCQVCLKELDIPQVRQTRILILGDLGRGVKVGTAEVVEQEPAEFGRMRHICHLIELTTVEFGAQKLAEARELDVTELLVCGELTEGLAVGPDVSVGYAKEICHKMLLVVFISERGWGLTVVDQPVGDDSQLSTRRVHIGDGGAESINVGEGKLLGLVGKTSEDLVSVVGGFCWERRQTHADGLAVLDLVVDESGKLEPVGSGAVGGGLGPLEPIPGDDL